MSVHPKHGWSAWLSWKNWFHLSSSDFLQHLSINQQQHSYVIPSIFVETQPHLSPSTNSSTIGSYPIFLGFLVVWDFQGRKYTSIQYLIKAHPYLWIRGIIQARWMLHPTCHAALLLIPLAFQTWGFFRRDFQSLVCLHSQHLTWYIFWVVHLQPLNFQERNSLFLGVYICINI